MKREEKKSKYKIEEIYKVQLALIAISHNNKSYKKCVENNVVLKDI